MDGILCLPTYLVAVKVPEFLPRVILFSRLIVLEQRHRDSAFVQILWKQHKKNRWELEGSLENAFQLILIKYFKLFRISLWTKNFAYLSRDCRSVRWWKMFGFVVVFVSVEVASGSPHRQMNYAQNCRLKCSRGGLIVECRRKINLQK